MKVFAKSTDTITLATCNVWWRHEEGTSMYWDKSLTVVMLHIVLCFVLMLGEWLLLMKNSGGERMYYPYGKYILSPTDFVDVGSESLDRSELCRWFSRPSCSFVVKISPKRKKSKTSRYLSPKNHTKNNGLWTKWLINSHWHHQITPNIML